MANLVPIVRVLLTAAALLAIGCGSTTTPRSAERYCEQMDAFLLSCGDDGVSSDCAQKIATCDAGALNAVNGFLDCVQADGCGAVVRCLVDHPTPSCAAATG